MTKYCSECGVENSDAAKFCIKCGKPLVEIKTETEEKVGEYKCPRCDKSIPIGINICPYCGNVLIKEDYTGAKVIGYLFTILTLFFGFIPGIIGIIIGIYIISRENQEIRKHGIIMIILNVLFTIINFIFALVFLSSFHSISYYY